MSVSSARNPIFVKFARTLPFLLILLILLPSVLAHGEEISEHAEDDEHSEEEHAEQSTVGIEEYIKATSMKSVLAGLVIVAILSLYAILNRKAVQKNNVQKIAIFASIVIVVLAATFYTAGSTIYLNVISQTGGPVHWHADFEIWSCGEKLDLADPSGLANRIGTSTFHEHGDDRIHVEGVVINDEDVNLHSFFHVIGGNLAQDSISMPTNDGLLDASNGDMCNDQPGTLQVFVYKVTNPGEQKNWTYQQIKLDNIEDYVLSPATNMPPGDCIIVEFDQQKDSTDKICETFRLAIERGELSGG